MAGSYKHLEQYNGNPVFSCILTRLTCLTQIIHLFYAREVVITIDMVNYVSMIVYIMVRSKFMSCK